MRRILFLGLLAFSSPLILNAQGIPSTPTASALGDTTAFSTSQIAAAIRKSGLTQDQIRARLQAAGFDPRLADPYFAGGVANSVSPGDSSKVADAGFVGALKALGLLQTDLSDSTANATANTGSVEPAGRTRTARRGLQIFGSDVFSSGTSAFDAVAAGPVDASYRLGIGDQVQLIITGDMEMAVGLDVRRDGTILIPQIGQVPVAGLTVEAARTNVKQRAARVYSVIDEGRARVDLSVSRVRNNQIFVIGEVDRPGSYQINALGTVFRALAMAGGPTARGTYRDVEVRRGGAVVARIDLYNYLLKGDASSDIRTEQGDIIFVGLSRRLVTLQGAVRRPGIYELLPGERLAQLLEFGGGLLPTAATDRLQIDRILPPADRAPGKERALIDVPIGDPASLQKVELFDNDVISVFSVGDVRRNRVALKGEVFEPGIYEWVPGLTLGQLVNRAQGFLPWALTDRIKIIRQIPFTGRTELYSVNARDSALDKIQLQEYDEVTVLDARRAYPSGTVEISGSVLAPGERPLAENMTLLDLVDLAGGFKPEAAVVELARKNQTARYSDTVAVIRSFEVLPGGRLDPEAARTPLQRSDRVNVRDFPGYRTVPRSVTLAGLFTYPGTYVLRSDAERVSDVVRRASGLLPSAYARSARLTRDGRAVAIDLDKALKGDKAHDIFLAEGDRLEVGPDPSVVYVSGAVERQVIVPFQRGWSVEDYIRAAGGYTADADKKNIVVEYPSGEVLSRRSSFFRPSGDPRVISGSTITVGQQPEGKGGNAGEVLTRTVQLVTTLVSLIIGYKAVSR